MRASLPPAVAALLATALVALLAACQELPPYVAKPYVDFGDEPVVCEKRERDADGRLLREWLCRIETDGSWTKIGYDRAWWPAGGIRWQRDYEEGRPRGTWHSWFPSGLLESQVPLDEPATPGNPPLATWWHPNGLRAAQGPMRDGVKHGRWSFWRADGTLAEEGDFEGGVQHDEWSQWGADGSLEARGRYERGVRVGDWAPTVEVEPATQPRSQGSAPSELP